MGTILFYAIIFWVLYKLFAKFKFASGGSFSNRRAFSQDEAKFLVALLAKVAKGDGRVSELEARLVSQTFDDLVRKTGVDRAELKAIFDTEKELVDEAYEVALEYRQKLHLDRQTAIARITFFLNLAYFDGEFHPDERKVIEDISRGFGIDRALLDAIILRFEQFYNAHSRHYNRSQNTHSPARRDAYEVLGVARDSEFGVIKKRYRELVRKYHPDILMGQGESEEVIEKSTKKLQEINEAYESIKNERGES
ncbi:TerB family tellurite resistance protein [Campylobacter suis]|uniref:Co-chaperone protein DjlA n=1 Tax=Campylobacter suis TaxID=2790657 RepID=A0ABM8Q174_9BACT|nr:TerB family tellurite resistance protein [Campylobacter suis]CAD7286560.1 Co-chaperone protein DjlA [Campylobacter suis]